MKPLREKPVDLDDALAYLKHVKDTLLFHDNRAEYDMFREVIKDFKARKIDTDGVIRRMKALLKGRGSLILGLNIFLPEGYSITLNDRRGSSETIVTSLSEGDGSGSPESSSVEFEEAVAFFNKVKHRFQDDNKVFASILDILRMFGEGRKGVRQVYVEVAALLDDHPDLLEEFTRFLPNATATTAAQFGRNKRQGVCDMDEDRSMMKSRKETRERRRRDHREPEVEKAVQRLSTRRKPSSPIWQVEEHGDKVSVKKIKYSQGFNFCEKVKEKLRDQDDYQAFLKCLHHYSTGMGTREDLQSLVADLLGGCPDLMQEFDAFLELCENIEHGDQSHEDDRYSGKSTQELDLSDCRRCTPSYRLLPDDYPVPTTSGRDELDRQVLNDQWVCAPPMSCNEDYSFKHKRMSEYEERMFRCEDERFELDMLSESLNSTVTNVEKLLNNMNKDENATVIDINQHLTAQNLRCIERLYGDYGAEVRKEISSRNPCVALPIVLTRLKKKRDELTKCRGDFNESWAEIYARNHDKSLDHCLKL